MPGGDQTGPVGYGPLTGRGLGPCGRGLAFRRGFGGRYIEPVTLTKEEQKKILKAEKEQLEIELKKINEKMQEK